MKTFPRYVLFLVLAYTQTTTSQIANFPLHFENVLESRLGLGWPHELQVARGHEALLKLSRTMVNQVNCQIRTPSGETFNHNQLPSRYEIWTNGCGIRIRNISATDEGRWRLTSIRGNDSLVGYIPVHVLEPVSIDESQTIYLEDGKANSFVNLTHLNNFYCMVTQPFAQSALVPGHCEVTLDKTSRAIQGQWKVQLGLPGQIPEVPVERQVTVQSETLDRGFIHDTTYNKLHIYCNIENGNKNITFCRFQHTAGSAGYNVIDGLSNGYFSYYGEGFVHKQCGITIERPSAEDFSTWRCSVGVQEEVDGVVVPSVPLQALISISSARFLTVLEKNTSSSDVEDTRKIFTQTGTELKMDCHVEQSLTYCWFQHPNGTQYTPVGDGMLDELQFWYSGESLQMGDCSISFADADESLSGLWTCHMGSSNNLGVELTDRLRVRVSGPLTANKQEINTTLYEKETLYCHTSGGTRSINYCRFVSPNFVGINIDPSVTIDNPIMGRYYFTQNRSLDYGDCSLTIDPVQPEDLGNWTCAALIAGLTLESRDYIQLNYAETVGLSKASVAGITMGVIVLLVIVVGSVVFRHRIMNFVRKRSDRSVSMQEIIRPSISSGESNTSSNASI